MALPASIVENAQGGELKALLVGQMARALTIYGVDEAMMGCDGMGETDFLMNGVIFIYYGMMGLLGILFYPKITYEWDGGY